MNDSLRLMPISHSLARCSATTKNDNVANNLVKTSAGTAVNDYGETFWHCCLIKITERS
jgi:hypothetical protein